MDSLNSNNRPEQALRLRHLQCIGKILAGFTHESKNYLAIINESTGLMGDMLQMGKTTEKDVAEYLEIIRSVEDQIRRANNHFRALNQFGHRMDAEFSSYALNEIISELVALVTRFANQKKITLRKSLQEDIPAIHGNPSLLQFVIFSILEEVLSTLDIESTITIETWRDNDGVQIKVIPSGNRREQEHAPAIPDEILAKAVQQLCGTITRMQDGATLVMVPLTVSFHD
ncbi:MAG: hypothetical protein ACOYVJ_01090 [Nitrospirota bacterium]